MRELADKCAELKEMKDQLDKQYKSVKKNLVDECKNNCIMEFNTDLIHVKISESRRFKGYDDNKLVLQMIPLQHRDECVSLDRKKIDSLIKKGVLPHSIKDEEDYTRVTTVKFTELDD